jgi:putative addiction module component (TIGR02574 family)
VILERFPNLQQLSPSEKLILVSELWNELQANPLDVPVSADVIAELDRRMEHFEKHPEEFRTWESVKARVVGSKA